MTISFRAASWPAYKRLLQRSPWPILCGPWRSELGFESLYWVPFVQALGISPDRLIPITRGGAAYWYGSNQGIELFDIRQPKDVRIENMLQHAKTGMLKQNAVTPFDRAIVKDAAKLIGLKRYHVLHPSWMYQALTPFWEGRTGVEWLWPHLTRQVITEAGKPARLIETPRVPPLPAGVTLPKGFCAVRFYLRATFPNCEATVQLAKASIRQIAANQPVVLMNPGVHADEHMDLEVRDIPNVYRLKDLVPGITPQNNLAVQSAVLAQCAGFVGTYGGLAQLALRLRRPSLSYFLDWKGTALAHKHLSDALSIQTGTPFLTCRIGDIPVLKMIVPEIAYTTASSGPVQPVEDTRAERAADHHVEASV